MANWLSATVVGAITQYGSLAVFVYMVLETAFVLHFVPSEVVVPLAASQLVYDPVTFVAFVAVTTAGATVGSVLAYWLFGVHGRTALERYGRVVHVSPRALAWSEAAFRRYGESAVFWGRMLPLVRAVVSIPAGLAGMNRRRFVLYSAAGSGVFDTALTYLVYTGSGETSPLGAALASARTVGRSAVTDAGSHAPFVVAALALLAVVCGVLLVVGGDRGA